MAQAFDELMRTLFETLLTAHPGDLDALVTQVADYSRRFPRTVGRAPVLRDLFSAIEQAAELNTGNAQPCAHPHVSPAGFCLTCGRRPEVA